MKIGIFGGSFNPIHSGHAILLNHLSQSGIFDEIWIMVNRLNPLKEKQTLTSESHRLEMARLVASKLKNVKVSDIEMTLPEPSYTYHTLEFLKNNFPQDTFSILIGSDNWEIFDRWYKSKEILENHQVFIYPRGGYEIKKTGRPQRFLENCPVTEISSSKIRDMVKKCQNITFLVPDDVKTYITINNLYK